VNHDRQRAPLYLPDVEGPRREYTTASPLDRAPARGESRGARASPKTFTMTRGVASLKQRPRRVHELGRFRDLGPERETHPKPPPR
jgi:hypothetical protein